MQIGGGLRSVCVIWPRCKGIGNEFSGAAVETLLFDAAKMILSVLVAALLLGSATQDPPTDNDRAPLLGSLPIRRAPKSVYRISRALDSAVIVGAGLTITIPYALTDKLITPHCPCDPREVNSFDRGAIGNASDAAGVASDITAALAAIGPVTLDLVDVGATPVLLEDIVILSETLAVNGALVTIAKYTTQRPVPRVYLLQAPGTPGGYRSFYSGHTSFAFAALSSAAMTWTLRHGPSPWPWVITLLLGASVAVERVLGGYHFPTDVLVGAAMGTAVGIGIPWLHQRSATPLGSLRWVPKANGITLVGVF